MTAWPASLPQTPLAEDWSGGPQRNKVTFKPEIGATIDRRRGSAAGYTFSGTFAPLTDAQLTAFLTFFHTTLVDGTLPFTWADPVNGTTYNWKFTDDDPPFTIKTYRADLHTLAVKLFRKP